MSSEKSLKVAVLASGAGTNLQALLDQVHGREGITIVAVASDNPDAQALERAAAAGVSTAVFPRREFGGDRIARDRALASWLRERGTQLVVMAGYMQMVSEPFLDRFSDAVINVHPSLLPAFPGIDAVSQAISYGVKLFGVTVHFADAGLDTGPVIMQRSVALPDARELDDVLPHIHEIEHQMLPEVVRLFARGAVRIASTHPRRVLVGPLAVLPEHPVERFAVESRLMTTGTNAEQSLQPSAPGEVQVARALLSVSDKAGIVEFARGLADLGVEIISTGGTARELSEAGIPVRSISDLTGFPEIMDGRVKTLHPKLYASLLAVRDDPAHVEAAVAHEVEPVDLVCVNLYPFERTAATRGVSDDEVIENIDVGGPTMIRAAAKNFKFAAPVVSPASYDAIIDELRNSDRRLSLQTRESLAAEAFAYTARYDTAITRWFQEKHEDFPPLMVRAFERELELPYGENPHQRAAFYTQVGARTHVLSQIAQLGGKDLSFNNLLDLDSARQLLAEFVVPACVIVKHNNPCGVAVGTNTLEAYERAFACDPSSAFGGVIVLNRRVDKQTANAIHDQFAEIVLARGFDDEALEIFADKPNMRILDDRERRLDVFYEPAVRQVIGGLLVQDRDSSNEEREEMEVVSERRPTEDEWSELLFAWRVCKHVKSNAIVVANNGATIGIGAGQMSRVDSVRLAIDKAEGPVRGSVLASDAYFPFPDGPEIALEQGVTAIIQPGGSIRDPLVVEAVDRAGAAMVFTGRRHFRH